MLVLKACITVNKLGITCFFETYLDLSTRPDDDDFEIAGYYMARADQPTNTKRGEVCIYYKNCLPLNILNIVFLNECIDFALRIGEETFNFVLIYRSWIQSQEVLENFCQNFGRTSDNLAGNNLILLAAIVHVNANLVNWCANHKLVLKAIKLIITWTAIWINWSHLKIRANEYFRLILFLYWPNFYFSIQLCYWIRLHPSLHQNCHHQIIYAQVNL